MDRIKSFIREWQDVLVWLPVAFALLLLATWAIRWFDPRAGVDGLGFLQGYAALLFKGVLVTIMAWLCKRTYTRDWDDKDEIKLVQTAQTGQWQAYAIDRLEWLGWLGLWYMVLSG